MRVRKLARRVGQIVAVAAVGAVLTVGGSSLATADEAEGRTPDVPLWESEDPNRESEDPVEEPEDSGGPGTVAPLFNPIWE